MRKPVPNCWVVVHHEFIGLPAESRVDVIQCHVATSLAKAEAYFRRRYTSAHGWWQIHAHRIDDETCTNDGLEVCFYSHRGTRLTRPPIARAREAFFRDVARNPDWYRARKR
jgi:hypothetical protein